MPHGYPEHTVDLGEVVMNYAMTRPQPPGATADSRPDGILVGIRAGDAIAGSGFSYLRSRSPRPGPVRRTPGRYTLDNMGNDLVRFIQLVIGRPCIVAGLSLGGVLSCWLSAYSPPGLIRGAYYEDAPLFHSEVAPACGHAIRQGGIGNIFPLFSKYLGDQWSVGDWKGMIAAAPSMLPEWMASWAPRGEEPPQNLKEYDPEWAGAFWSGTATIGCDHARMLKSVKVQVLFTHHFRKINPVNGALMGAVSDQQVNEARRLIEGAGQRFEYRSFPEMGHSLHGQDPALYAATLRAWTQSLPHAV